VLVEMDGFEANEGPSSSSAATQTVPTLLEPPRLLRPRAAFEPPDHGAEPGCRRPREDPLPRPYAQGWPLAGLTVDPRR